MKKNILMLCLSLFLFFNLNLKVHALDTTTVVIPEPYVNDMIMYVGCRYQGNINLYLISLNPSERYNDIISKSNILQCTISSNKLSVYFDTRYGGYYVIKVWEQKTGQWSSFKSGNINPGTGGTTPNRLEVPIISSGSITSYCWKGGNGFINSSLNNTLDITWNNGNYSVSNINKSLNTIITKLDKLDLINTSINSNHNAMTNTISNNHKSMTNTISNFKTDLTNLLTSNHNDIKGLLQVINSNITGAVTPNIVNNDKTNENLSTSVTDYDSYESTATGNFNKSLSDISTDIDLFSNSDFIKTGQWVSTQVQTIYENDVMGLIATFSLVIGLALALIGFRINNK